MYAFLTSSTISLKLGPVGDADEGVMVPGDDDQLSYVSAPASDYSVTTVGSDMLHTSRMSDDEEEDERHVEPPAKVGLLYKM